MDSNTTNLFNLDDMNDALVERIIKDVNDALLERHYNPVNQIVGYLMSGDPGYISSHREARTKISQMDRAEILEVLVRSYIRNLK